METSALMGMNVAQLVVNDYLQLLAEKSQGGESPSDTQFVFGELGKNGEADEL